MRGREREEVSSVWPLPPRFSKSLLMASFVDPLLLDVISRFLMVRLTLFWWNTFAPQHVRDFVCLRVDPVSTGVVGFCGYQLHLPLAGVSSLTSSATKPVHLAFRQH